MPVKMPRLPILFIACLLLAGASRAPAAELEKINVVYSSIAAASLSTWVPKEAGIYKKNGLDANLIYVAGSQAITTPISGDAHVAEGAGGAPIPRPPAGAGREVVWQVIQLIPSSAVT